MKTLALAFVAAALFVGAFFAVRQYDARGRDVRSVLAAVDSARAIARVDVVQDRAGYEREAGALVATTTRTATAAQRHRAVRGGLRVDPRTRIVTTVPDSAGRVDTLSTAPTVGEALLTADTALAIAADTMGAQALRTVGAADQALASADTLAAKDSAAIATRDVVIEQLEAHQRPRCGKKCKLAAAGGATVVVVVVVARLTTSALRRLRI